MRKKVKIKQNGLSKRRVKLSYQVVDGKIQINGISDIQMNKFEESLICYKELIDRFSEIKHDRKQLKVFLSLNRNPLFDLTGTKKFKTGLMSQGANINPVLMTSNDHFIQRTKGLEYILKEIEKNPAMEVVEYISLVIKYCSTVVLTKEEHKKVNSYARRNPELTNVKIYRKLGIKIPGLLAWYKKMNLVKAVEKVY